MRIRLVSMALACLGLVLLATARPPLAAAPGPEPGRDMAGGADLSFDPVALTELEDRLEPRLRAWLEQPDQARVLDLVALSSRRLDLSRIDPEARQLVWPGGEHVALLRLPAGELLRLAALPGLIELWSGEPEDLAAAAPSVIVSAEPSPSRGSAPSVPEPSSREETGGDEPTGATEVVSAADPASGQSLLRLDAPEASDWTVQHGGSAAGEAWAMGYRGQGVRVGLVDEAVDFAHPDLQGTWAVLPEGHPQAGWPQVFDPVAAYLLNSDNRTAVDNRASRNARTGRIELYQRSAVSPREIDGELRPTACFRALEWISYRQTLLEERCDFIVPEGSQSGELRYGHHPDTTLRSLFADRDQDITGRAPGVLLLDAREAGVYDTVYVDLDGDRDFSDEKPVTKDSPLALHDLDGDGLADRSGGLLYFISDGVSPYPGAWLFGMQELVFAPGEVIGLLYASNFNGTAAASGIVAQGRLGLPEGHALNLRDLPGGGRERMSLGTAPEARLVSIGPLNYGRVAYEAGWRYGLYGHDPEREDDDLQVLAYPYSSTFLEHDGWDYESRLMEHYLQVAEQPTLFVLGSGASGPGYGSNLGPMPEQALTVASATHLGGTGMDSINASSQIAFGDVIPFSGAGPGTDGGSFPHLAADGAYSAGAISLNYLANQGRDGSLANQTLGGPRRAAGVAAGAAALVYQAFREREGRWPAAAEARAILMGGARFQGYDVFQSGAGTLDAGDAVRIAAGAAGLYAEPPYWSVGAEDRPGFVPLVEPGETRRQTIRLHNPTDAPIELRIRAARPRRIGSAEASLVTTNTQESREPLVPDYLLPIDRATIPEGTELMMVRGRMPQDHFDVTGNERPDNHYSLGVLQHTDLDGDGRLWEDLNGNGVVNSLPLSQVYVEADWGGVQRQLRALEADFTPALDEAGIAGELALYGMACNDAEGSPTPPEQPQAGKVALIERGTCTFYEKLSNALASGALAAIVYSDDREATAMGSEDGALDLPALMIDRQPGLAMVEALRGGQTIEVLLRRRSALVPWGLDGQRPVSYLDSEIEGLEFMRLNYDSTPRHHWAVPVHHPRERWGDGLYVALWHTRASGAITRTELALRYDFYAWQDWPVLDASAETLTLAPGARQELELALSVPEDAPFGALQGALLIDYARPPGEPRLDGPAAWEPEDRRLVLPVLTQVKARLEAGGSLQLIGPEQRDPDAPMDPAAVRGLWGWGQRAENVDRGSGNEAGDWRLRFFEVAGTGAGDRWLAFTRWIDPVDGGADVDSRFYAPQLDAFTSPTSATESAGGTRLSDPDWFGPHGMELVERSEDVRVYYTGKPFDTTTGVDEDWFVLPAEDGLHELALQTVRFSGAALDMPIEAGVGAVRWSPQRLELAGEACAEISVTSQIAMPSFSAEAHGVSVPILRRRVQAAQDDPADRGSASYRVDLRLDEPAAFFEVRMAHDEGNNLDLLLLYDADGNGEFAYPGEVLQQNYGGTAVELIYLDAPQPAGRYQVWVYGQRIDTAGATFDLLIDVVSGDAIELRGLPERLEAGEPATFEACVDPDRARGIWDPARGIVSFGPGAMPSLLEVPLRWLPGEPPAIFLPLSLDGASAR